MTPTAAQQLAESVVADGFGSHRAALAALFAGARRRGVDPAVVAIAADPTEPVVVRERALGRVVVDYCRLVEAAAVTAVAAMAPCAEPCGATAA